MSERLAGLGINVEPPRGSTRSSERHTSQVMTCPRNDSREPDDTNRHETRDPSVSLSSSLANLPALRSTTAMRGLLLAEVGDATVEFDVCGNGSGFREGRRILLEHVTPGGGSDSEPMKKPLKDQKLLTRHGTLLSEGADPGRNAAELKSLLGNSRARLKSGATVLPPVGENHKEDLLTFEQAKARAQVEVDIVLESNVCVQGGYLQGCVRIRIQKRSRNDSAVLLSECKVRVVGFECIPNTDVRHTFYHCAAPLSSIADTSPQFYISGADEEGFSRVKEGLHVVSFAMLLPIEGESSAKGVLHDHSGAKVRYIAMASVKVKNADTDKRSISHFYRNCEVWPRLNPSVILVPATRPLRASTSKKLFMGGSGKLNLQATLHRLYWIAGQQCCINITVKNDTKKMVRSLTLALIRTTVIFKPRPDLDALNPDREHPADPDACQTSTIQKQVAESTLHMGHHATRGHVSAKGWWTGVCPGETSHFSHFLLLPADALSITRGRLLEVEYSIRVSLGTVSLASDVHVVLPVRIINFLSIDPPPNFAPDCPKEEHTLNPVYGGIYLPAQGRNRSRPVIRELFPSEEGGQSQSKDTFPQFDSDPSRESELSRTNYLDASLQSTQNDSDFHEPEGDTEADTTSSHLMDHSESVDELGNLVLDDDSDDAVNDAIGSIATAYRRDICMARFSDLYYATLEENGPPSANRQEILQGDLASAPSASEFVSESNGARPAPPKTSQTTSNFTDATCPRGISAAEHPTTSPARHTCLSSFASRVEEKLQASGLCGMAFSAMSQNPCDTAYDAVLDQTPSGKAKDINLDHMANISSELGTELSRSRSTPEGPRSCHDPAVNLDCQGYATIPKARPLPIAPRAAMKDDSGSSHDPDDQHRPAAICRLSVLEASSTLETSIGTSEVCTVVMSQLTSLESSQCPQLSIPTIQKPDGKGLTSASCAGDRSLERQGMAVHRQPKPSLPSSGSDLAKIGPLSSVKARVKELEERTRASGGA